MANSLFRSLPRRTPAIAGAVVALVALAARPAAAHALVVSTRPAIDAIVASPPAHVTVRFNEPVEISFGALRVYDSDARRVDAGSSDHPAGAPDAVTVPLEPRLPKGTYTVTYRVVSADSHPVEGGFVFHVEKPGPRPQGILRQVLGAQSSSSLLAQLLFGAARWALFAGLLVLGGAVLFVVLVWDRTRTSLDRDDRLDARFAVRWRRLAAWSWAGALAATIVQVPLQGSVAGGLPLGRALGAQAVGEVLSTRFGRFSLLRIALLGGAAALWIAAARTGWLPGGAPARTSPSVGAARVPQLLPAWGSAAAVALVVALLATPGLAGHAGATPPLWVNVPADVAHVVAAAAWIGGLVTLAAAAWPAARDTGAVRSLAPIVGRFSDVAVTAVAVVVATGVVRSWVETGSLEALSGTGYGRVLLAKVGVFVPLLALGAVNNRWSKPRLAAAAASGDAATVAPTVRRVVVWEVALGVVVVALTALLVNLPPARVVAGTSVFSRTVPLGNDNLAVIVDPNRVGNNEVHLTLTSPRGAPVTVRSMSVDFAMPAQNIGPIAADGTKLARGHFVVQGHQLSIEGRWRLTIRARLDKFTERSARVDVDVGG